MKLYTELHCDHTATINEDLRKVFHLSSNAVTENYDHHLNISIKGIYKIALSLSNQKLNIPISLPHRIAPRIFLFNSFDFAHYFAQPKMERRKIVLETLHSSICEIPKYYPLDLVPFERAYQKVKDANYICRFIYGKLTATKNRLFKAGIEIEINETEATISVLFTDKDENPLKRVELLKTMPHYLFIYRVIHKGQWISNSEYVVCSKSYNYQFKTSLESNTAELFLNTEQHSEEKLRAVLQEIAPKNDLIEV